MPDDGVERGRKKGLEGVFGGLNIACPLDQGERMREWLDLSEEGDVLIREYLGRGRESAKIEEKKEQDEEVVAQRKKEYAARARSYNKHWARPESYPSQTAGILLSVTMAVLIGTALWRGGAHAARR